MAWGTSSAWQVGQQEDIRGIPCGRDFIPIGIGLYLQEFTPGVQEVDYSAGPFHKESDMVIHYHDVLLIYSMQGALGTYTLLDSERSKGCTIVIKLAWVPTIE